MWVFIFIFSHLFIVVLTQGAPLFTQDQNDALWNHSVGCETCLTTGNPMLCTIYKSWLEFYTQQAIEKLRPTQPSQPNQSPTYQLPTRLAGAESLPVGSLSATGKWKTVPNKRSLSIRDGTGQQPRVDNAERPNKRGKIDAREATNIQSNVDPELEADRRERDERRRIYDMERMRSKRQKIRENLAEYDEYKKRDSERKKRERAIKKQQRKNMGQV